MIFGHLAVWFGWFGLVSLVGVGLGYLVCLGLFLLLNCSDSRLPLSIGRVMIPIGVGLFLFSLEKGCYLLEPLVFVLDFWMIRSSFQTRASAFASHGLIG